MHEPPPEALVHVRPEGDKNVILKKKGKLSEAAMQRKFFSCLTLIDDFDKQVERYRDKNEKKIAPRYLAQKRSDDLMIDTGWDIYLKEDE